MPNISNYFTAFGVVTSVISTFLSSGFKRSVAIRLLHGAASRALQLSLNAAYICRHNHMPRSRIRSIHAHTGSEIVRPP